MGQNCKEIAKVHVGYQIKGSLNHSSDTAFICEPFKTFGHQGPNSSENFDKIAKVHASIKLQKLLSNI